MRSTPTAAGRRVIREGPIELMVKGVFVAPHASAVTWLKTLALSREFPVLRASGGGRMDPSGGGPTCGGVASEQMFRSLRLARIRALPGSPLPSGPRTRRIEATTVFVDRTLGLRGHLRWRSEIGELWDSYGSDSEEFLDGGDCVVVLARVCSRKGQRRRGGAAPGVAGPVERRTRQRDPPLPRLGAWLARCRADGVGDVGGEHHGNRSRGIDAFNRSDVEALADVVTPDLGLPALEHGRGRAFLRVPRARGHRNVLRGRTQHMGGAARAGSWVRDLGDSVLLLGGRMRSGRGSGVVVGCCPGSHLRLPRWQGLARPHLSRSRRGVAGGGSGGVGDV